ncbi:MAG: ATP-binding cassette domain-containing protein [Defluviitaleaceae bacterium]|nr:ATP-binding cassette domain-containing protein [Defluviitaleaceae bacterium]
MGIVGESGCGKSTLGRVILQLLVQTEGETVYYGRTIDEVVPMYALDIFKNLDRKCTQSKINMKKLEEMEAAYDALEKEIGGDKDPAKRKLMFEKLNEKILYRRKVYSEFLSIVRLVGGMYGLDDYAEASRILMDFFKAALAERSITLGLSKLRLQIAETQYKVDKNPTTANKAKLDALKKKLDGIVNGDLKKADDLRLEKQEIINEFRARYEDIPEYQKYDSYRDAGIDLARLTYSEMRLLRKD